MKRVHRNKFKSHLYTATGCFAIMLVLVGCATSHPQPYFENPSMENHQLTLLDETVIAVKVNDPYKIVKKVEGVVLEDTTGLVFPFHDDGKKGDTEANDDIWSIQVKVPYDGWAGTFTFKITAYNAEHEAIIVRNNLDEVSPMTTTLNVEVQQSKPVVDVPAP